MCPFQAWARVTATPVDSSVSLDNRVGNRRTELLKNVLSLWSYKCHEVVRCRSVSQGLPPWNGGSVRRSPRGLRGCPPFPQWAVADTPTAHWGNGGDSPCRTERSLGLGGSDVGVSSCNQQVHHRGRVIATAFSRNCAPNCWPNFVCRNFLPPGVGPEVFAKILFEQFCFRRTNRCINGVMMHPTTVHHAVQ